MPVTTTFYLGKQTVQKHVEQALAEIVQPDEWLLAAVRGVVASGEGYGADTKRKGGLFSRGYLLVTDQRLILWGRGVFSRNVNTFSFDDIASVEESQGLLLGGIVLNVRGAKQQVRAMYNQDVPVAARLIRDLVVRSKGGKSQPVAPLPVTPSQAIYILGDDGAQNGPYDSAQVRRKFSAGEVQADAYGWHEGLAEWLPLSQIVQTLTPSSLPLATSPASAMATQFAPVGPLTPTQPATSNAVPTVPQQPHAPWYKRKGWQIAFFIFFPYAQVPLMWYWKLFTRRTRIWVTVGGCIWFLVILASPSPTEARKKELAENRTALMAQVRAADQTHDYQRVLALGERYARVHDPELDGYLYTAHTAIKAAQDKEAMEKAAAAPVKDWSGLTKAQWKDKVARTFQWVSVIPLNAPAARFQEVMGKPNRTQTVGNQAFWYYDCSDGTIQMEMDPFVLQMGTIQAQINDY